MAEYTPQKCRRPGCDGLSLRGTYYTCAECGQRWWFPNAGPQTTFLASTVREILYGGAAGGGKSVALCMLPLRWAHVPGFNGIVFRRETGQLAELIKQCDEWYDKEPFCGTRKNEGKGVLWTFPAGGQFRLQHLKDPADAFNFQGWELQFIGFDELTHFTWTQYRELKSRCRNTKPNLPRYIRSTSNPGGVGHEWVLKRWGAWLNPKFETARGEGKFTVDEKEVYTTYGLEKREGKPYLDPCETAYVLKPDGRDEEFFVPKDTPGALTRTFIPARLRDNPILMQADPDYSRALADNDKVRREQLEDGNWLAVAGAGDYFKRAWFKFYDSLPADAKVVRYWDRAATEQKEEEKQDDPDWTVGFRMARVGDDYFIDDIVRFRESPGGTEKRIKEVTESDGPLVTQCLEQDPGSAGKFEVYHYMRALSNARVLPIRPTGDKIVRAGPFSTHCQAGHVYARRNAPWLDAWFQEAEAFPTKGIHDDQIDGGSGAYFVLHKMGGPHKSSVRTGDENGSAAAPDETHSWNDAGFG